MRTHISLLRGSHRPDALVLLTLFKGGAGWSNYYPGTLAQVLDCHPPLVTSIAADLHRLPGHSLGLIVGEPDPQPADWGTLLEHFKAPRTSNGQPLSAEQQQAEQQRRHAAWLSGCRDRWCYPIQWGCRDAHIGPIWWLFAECDAEGLAPADQLALAVRVAGTEPAFTIATGGKSVHCYWRLLEPISRERFKALQQLLAAAAEHLQPGCKADRTISNPARVMRLAGGTHPSTGQLASIYTAGGPVVCADALEARLRGLLPPPAAPAARPRPSAARPGHRPLSGHHRPGPHTLEQITEALGLIQPFASGQGQRDEFRRFAAGLRAAVLEAGGDEQQALALCQQHSPGVLDAADYWRTDWQQIHATSFWWMARQAGWRPRRGPDLDRIKAARAAAFGGGAR